MGYFSGDLFKLGLVLDVLILSFLGGLLLITFDCGLLWWVVPLVLFICYLL